MNSSSFRICCMAFLFFIFVLVGISFAQTKEQLEQEATNKFAGINFGVGISLTIDTGSHDRIQDAVLIGDDNIVRVTKQQNDIPRIMLETHYFFLPDCKFFFDSVPKDSWGFGPFIGIQNGSDEIIQAIGAGIMIGFRRSDKTSKDSFNIGIGAVVDPSVTILGDGIKENQPLPSDEDQIRYKTTSQWGVLILTSYAF